MHHSGEKNSKFNLGKLLIFAFGIALILILIFYLLFSRDTINPIYFDETASYKISEDMHIEALPSSVPFEVSADNEVERIGTISHKQALIVGEQQSLLYPTFDNKDVVFERLQKEIPQLLSKIQEDYRLSPVHEGNLNDYAVKARDYLDTFPGGTSGDPVLDEQIDILRSTDGFFVHYRDNARIIDYIVNANPIDEQQVYMMMPDNSPYSIDYIEKYGAPMEQELP